MESKVLNQEIEADIRSRFNNVGDITPIVIRKNAKAHVAYVNQTIDGNGYYVGIIYIKKEPVRVLVIEKEEIYKF